MPECQFPDVLRLEVHLRRFARWTLLFCSVLDSTTAATFALRLHPRKYRLGPLSHSPSAMNCLVMFAWPAANRRDYRSFFRRLSSWVISWWKCTSQVVEPTNQWRGQMRSRYVNAWHHCNTGQGPPLVPMRQVWGALSLAIM